MSREREDIVKWSLRSTCRLLCVEIYYCIFENLVIPEVCARHQEIIQTAILTPAGVHIWEAVCDSQTAVRTKPLPEILACLCSYRV